ncbi:Heat shock protein hsp88 [Claviceps purpurea]|uniref:Heat shock protein hsp88 n=2 Tax=Claviceps TaxID=5110 RepID=A0A9P7TZC3_9HYPO|nr:Heat shock protein hsp88 [Claviceps purpurea]KAG6286717.1 Heat shock protein hsp88 [Claviceps aff. purpurea]CCE31441.1 probable heat shock protein Hsp88 [Claviceps purpurea 20.1]KAG6135675.1 Heat shock protein hsp88 [Claviceps purpurea]KAG6137683.1 Heat shock protein hsp88 [Claviceps purpurea]
MSVVGVDFGTLKTVVAVARNRGVDVITNEVSNRATPSMVGFGPKSRYLGELAKTQEITNLKNTVSCLKRLAGRSFNDPDIKNEQQFVSAPLVDINGQVGVEVNYLGSTEKFTSTQLIAMYLSKIKQNTATELKLPVSELCMSVPAWFTDAQRRALLDAAEIAGLKVLRLINDTTAAALGWGITKLDLPAADEKPRRVCFVDIGHSNYTCSIVEFKKGELAVKSTAWDRNFGGRDFDRALVEHLAKEFKGKYKVDIYTHGRAMARTLAAAEKTKKILSANQQAPVNIESVMNDIDVSALITRQEFEAMIEPILARTHEPLEQALAQANLTKDDIDIIEIVGGGSRVPAVKERIQAFFSKPLSFTMNADEAIARGCAFSCAILSPVFRVRDFSVQDVVSYPIEFSWDKADDIPDEETSLTVFTKGNILPSTKILTFFRKQTFDLEARYLKPEDLPGKQNPWLGRFSVKGVKVEGQQEFMVCKLKARINIHGVLNVESGYYVEEQEVEEEIKDDEKEDGEKKDPDAMDMDKKDDAPKKTRKVKKQIRKGDLPISSGTSSLDASQKTALAEKEASMILEDKEVADTEEKKNELETYIYDLRAKLDEQYADLTTDEEKASIKGQLEAAEDWLYDEGDDASKGVYVAKLDELRALAGPIVQRHFEKVEAERIAVQERAAAEQAAKKAPEAEPEAEKAAQQTVDDQEMRDVDAAQPESERNTESK